jgi:cobalt-zinc-cadmium resistance protein CzcA
MPLKLITHLDVKRIISHKWIAFIVCALYGTASIAQPTTEAQAIDLALRHYPTVQLAEQNVLRHQAMERTAFNPPQPQATIEAPGDIGIGFEVVQEFDFPGVYHTRSRLLKSETGLATQGATLTRLDLKRIVRLAFLEVQTAQATTRLFSRQDSLWRDIARTSQRLFDGGEINKSELLFATTHAGQMTNALAKSQVAAENVKTQLSMFTGTQVALVSPLVKALDTVTDTEQPFYFEPYLRAREKVVQSEVAALRSERYPGLIFGYLHVPDLDTDYRTRFKAGITVPIWQGQYQGKINAAKISLNQTQTETALQRNQAQTARVQLLKTLGQTRNTLDWFEQSALSQTEDLIQTSMRLYEAGETDYILMLRNISDALELQKEYVEELKRHNQTIIELDYLMGM